VRAFFLCPRVTDGEMLLATAEDTRGDYSDLTVRVNIDTFVSSEATFSSTSSRSCHTGGARHPSCGGVLHRGARFPRDEPR
jgi:hypothetical protein